MTTRPGTLVAARATLEKAEEDFGDSGRLSQLRTAVNSLLELMSGASPKIEQDIAKKLILTYRDKVLSKAKIIIANVESYKPESLEHWNGLMEIFVDPSLPDDAEFNVCRGHLLTVRSSRDIDPLKSADLDNPQKKELPEASLQNDFYYRKAGTTRVLLHTESLRAIGRSLQMLRLQAFRLKKLGDVYIVRSESLTETHEWMLRNYLAEKVLDSPVPVMESAQLTAGDGWVCYGPHDIARLSARELKKVGDHGFEQVCGADKLVQLLGALGEQLDNKKAMAFEISWTPESVSVKYRTPSGAFEHKDFTIEKLQQLALYSRFRKL